MDIERPDENYSLYILDENEQRPCGECTACCTAMAVDEIGKPNYTRCQHECSRGCAIYGQHPNTCRAFACLWKVPNWILEDSDRPDKLGVVFYVRESNETKQLEVWEVWPGAAQQPRVKALLQAIQVDYLIVSPVVWSITI